MLTIIVLGCVSQSNSNIMMNKKKDNIKTIERIATGVYYSNYELDNRTLYRKCELEANASTISVSCLKITWQGDTSHKFDIFCSETDNTTDFQENICYDYISSDTCYITGLRENTKYRIVVTDITSDTSTFVLGKTESVNIIETFAHEDGWTNCFAGEAATGLTLDPSKSAIAGAIPDPVTDTGIMRNEYGDYCVAMGLFYGVCNDRFLVELENGTQFTVKICDSKGLADDGEGKYHYFGDTGKCIIEFIFSDYLPENVAYSGSYGYYDWDGLKFDNIKSISKIEYGEPISY